MTLNDAGMLNYLPVLFFVSYSSLGTATSFCLSLSLECLLAFPLASYWPVWDLQGLHPYKCGCCDYFSPRRTFPRGAAELCQMWFMRFASPGPAGRLCASWRDTKRGLKQWHWCLPQPLGKENLLSFLQEKGCRTCLSAQALQQPGRADSSDCRSRNLAECDKMLSQSFWKFRPTCEVEEGEKPQ